MAVRTTGDDIVCLSLHPSPWVEHLLRLRQQVRHTEKCEVVTLAGDRPETGFSPSTDQLWFLEHIV